MLRNNTFRNFAFLNVIFICDSKQFISVNIYLYFAIDCQIIRSIHFFLLSECTYKHDASQVL